jgi:hypothetical protein
MAPTRRIRTFGRTAVAVLSASTVLDARVSLPRPQHHRDTLRPHLPGSAENQSQTGLRRAKVGIKVVSDSGGPLVALFAAPSAPKNVVAVPADRPELTLCCQPSTAACGSLDENGAIVCRHHCQFPLFLIVAACKSSRHGSSKQQAAERAQYPVRTPTHFLATESPCEIPR